MTIWVDNIYSNTMPNITINEYNLTELLRVAADGIDLNYFLRNCNLSINTIN